MSEPVIVIGAGGHARVLLDVLRLRGVEVLGVVDNDCAKRGQTVGGVPVTGGDEEVQNHPAHGVRLVNAVGTVGVSPQRSGVFERFKQHGYRFAEVIHPSATIAADAVLCEGAQIMAGAIVQTGCRVGRNSILNTRASIDHDCEIGDHVHVAPGVTLSGNVSVGEGSHVGTGATVIQGVRIGRHCLIAAGAVVVRDVLDGVGVAGVPAREVGV
ncbi:MAG: acyltransferase [Betaproteobacteria bacterium]|nr:acyltransferase [Betaproteobacteria bacterium]